MWSCWIFKRIAHCVVRRAPRLIGTLSGLLVATSGAHAATIDCERNLRANVVALEQAIVLNRFGAFNPAGMLFALQRDVVFSGADGLYTESALPDPITPYGAAKAAAETVALAACADVVVARASL